MGNIWNETLTSAFLLPSKNASEVYQWFWYKNNLNIFVYEYVTKLYPPGLWQKQLKYKLFMWWYVYKVNYSLDLACPTDNK